MGHDVNILLTPSAPADRGPRSACEAVLSPWTITRLRQARLWWRAARGGALELIFITCSPFMGTSVNHSSSESPHTSGVPVAVGVADIVAGQCGAARAELRARHAHPVRKSQQLRREPSSCGASWLPLEPPRAAPGRGRRRPRRASASWARSVCEEKCVFGFGLGLLESW